MYVLNPTEIARGYLVGSSGRLPPPVDRSVRPRQRLEQLLLSSLERQPCAIAFSGGRDSSVLLALATHVARREGLPDPVPITRAFPALPETDEHSFQLEVIRHLGLADWARLEFTDELDIIGPYARRHLRQHGVIWPAAIATSVPLFEAVPGGTLVDGEGGDEVLGDDVHRIAAVNGVVRDRHRPLSRRLRTALAVVAPRPIRFRHVRRERASRPWPWLRHEERDRFITDLARDRVDQPLSWSASVRAITLRRAQRIANHNRSLLAASYGVELKSPLLDPDLVHALARMGGFRGPGTRSTVLHGLVSDLLPPGVLTRRSKAIFNRAYVSTYSLGLARSWRGEGVDLDLVDPEGLRQTWQSETPHWMSAALLQSVWMALDTEQRSVQPPTR